MKAKAAPKSANFERARDAARAQRHRPSPPGPRAPPSAPLRSTPPSSLPPSPAWPYAPLHGEGANPGARSGRDRAAGRGGDRRSAGALSRVILANVVLRIEDFADDEVLNSLGIEDPFDLTGLYSGRSMREENSWASGELPPMIHLYRRPLLDEWVETGRDARSAHHPCHRPRGRPPFRLFRRGHARDRGGGRMSALLRLEGVACRRGGRLLFEGLSLDARARRGGGADRARTGSASPP